MLPCVDIPVLHRNTDYKQILLQDKILIINRKLMKHPVSPLELGYCDYIIGIRILLLYYFVCCCHGDTHRVMLCNPAASSMS